MSKKDREQRRKQEQWEREKAEIEERRKKAPQAKAALRAKGCNLPFYDGLDSYEDEFKKLVAWGKDQFRSLHEVFEVGSKELDNEFDWQRLGFPADWHQVFFNCDDELARSYLLRDTKANLRGETTGFRDGEGGFHTIIRVVKNPKCSFEHKEHKYALKIPALLHELGHVKDFEEKINFDRDTETADLIEGEVFANLFALTECFRRAYYLSGKTYLDSLVAYKDAADYRGEVVRRVLARFQKPDFKEWTAYEL